MSVERVASDLLTQLNQPASGLLSRFYRVAAVLKDTAAMHQFEAEVSKWAVIMEIPHTATTPSLDKLKV